ncbi:hypothetical protein [Dyella choica]|uniref:Uncharacterized protein n=1 Tax=Dyella choica TaxID=1927959 RepID=A0A3S0WU52_9GAMM|nr:hypothetical protein [Dyella choica]RUL72722.1 hypothetical protein EKH80_16940 [Dyella choica]
MTTIFSAIDASFPLPKREDSRPLTEDFAHELAKPESQGKQLAPGNTKSMAAGEFDAQQVSEPVELDPHAAAGETLQQMPMQPTVLQTGEAAMVGTVAPAGATEALLQARVFGWHAMAQVYLSEMTLAEGDVRQLNAWQSDRTVLVTPAEAAGESLAMNVNATAAAARAEQADVAEPVDSLAVQSPLLLDDAAPSHVIETALAGSSAPALWPERSLRFTRQRDGGSVAWLRDFRLSDSEAKHLIRWVLNDARAKGLTLSTIMLNGREAWTSPQLI